MHTLFCIMQETTVFRDWNRLFAAGGALVPRIRQNRVLAKPGKSKVLQGKVGLAAKSFGVSANSIIDSSLPAGYITAMRSRDVPRTTKEQLLMFLAIYGYGQVPRLCVHVE